MAAETFISICIPTYNQTVFLVKTLDSISEQTFKNFEVIISDDSTTDEVKSLIQNYEQRFKVIYHHNTASLGSPTNWNKAMDLASGDLIKFMHHDDWFESPDALSKFVKPFDDKNISFAFCNSKILNVAKNNYSYNVPSYAFLKQLRIKPEILFNTNLIGAPSAVMFKKTQLRFDEKIKYVVDVDFYISLLKNNNCFAYIDEALIVNTSHHEGQVTAQSLNTEVQIGEHVYLYNKLFGNKMPDWKMSSFFVFLFRQYPIQSLKSILVFNRPLPRPTWYFSILLIIAKISLSLKKVTHQK